MEKYFIRNDQTGYRASILDNSFTGTSTEIFGKISFDKGKADNILDTIRGTGLNLQLEANVNLTFDEFSEADEQTYKTIVTKHGIIVFNGFLKPDGVIQSFVRDEWVVELDFIDGLGTLKDLSFVKSDGFNYTGKMSFYEVIEACLKRTGLSMTINSSIDVYYIGYTGTNILKDVYVNSERFFKIDDDTIMTCEEVMNSILNLLSACITQQDGQWWVYRPNDFVKNVVFTDNILNTTFTKNLYRKVGSQIDNYYPHHSGGNQQIQTKGAISAYRLNYKYGLKAGELLNGELKHDAYLNYDNWTKTLDLQGNTIINDPNDLTGIRMKVYPFFFYPVGVPQPPPRIDVLTSTPYSLVAGTQFDLVFKLKKKEVYPFSFYFKVKRSDNYYLDNNGLWQNSAEILEYIFINNSVDSEVIWTLKSEPVPANCTITIIIMTPKSNLSNNMVFEGEVESIQIINNFNYDGRIGEFHTVTRAVSPSSIVKNNQEVYNGDSIDQIFVGAIYKIDKTSLTTIWTRKNKLEEKSLLRISAEDDMRIQQKPIKCFSGSFFGEIDYLSIVEINNVSGLFMFVEYSYDTDANITNGKLQQFYIDEVADLNYALTFDYGKTVKPSIRS